MLKFGFIIATCLLKPVHQNALYNCITSIRKFHSNEKIVIIVDFTSIPSLVINTVNTYHNEINITFEINNPSIPADMLMHYYLNKKKYFQKAILLQDSMELLGKFETKQVSDIQYIWHFTNHRIHWDIIKEPETEYNKRHSIITHNDLLEHYIDKYITDTNLNQKCHQMNKRKDTWVGCFGCLCIIDIDFLEKFNNKTNILSIMPSMLTNRNRRVIESIFSLLCKCVTNRDMSNSFEGLYYDGITGNNLVSKRMRKISFNRNS
jgi:hypothetical protein